MNKAANRRLRVTPIGHVRPDVAVVDLETYYDPFGEVTLETLPRWAEAPAGLEEYDHPVVIFWFDRARRIRKPHPIVAGGRDGKSQIGLFATRTPRRSNPLGINIPRLLRREGSDLLVIGIDAWPGTPILDFETDAPRDELRPDPTVPDWLKSLLAAHDAEWRG